MNLNERSLTPLYQQVLEDIKAQISSGTYQSGDKLPSEAELSAMYSVSRVTIRRAIEELSSEGYLTSRQGKGTFVNTRKMTRKLRQVSGVVSFTDACAAMGMQPGARVITACSSPVDIESRGLFGRDCSQLVNITRVRTADGVPVMWEENYLPFEPYSFLLDMDLTDTSLCKVLTERTECESFKNKFHTIEVVSATVQLAKALEISAGDALFFEHAVLVDQQDRPVCLITRYPVGARFVYDLD